MTTYNLNPTDPGRQPSRHKHPEYIQHQPGYTEYDMIVFCHLRWEFVFQRPQHIITRFANHLRILVIEEPIPYNDHEENTARILKVSENITILQPMVKTIEDIGIILPQYVSQKNIPIGWFYSAAFSTVLNHLGFERVVYDCMDELSLFRGANPRLIDQEKYLLSEADIVFTGGKSLYEAKQKHHSNVHCFPSSVEHQHFRQALNGIKVPEDISHLSGPVIGYYGVIDERIDLALLDDIARLNPEASFVMIGPLAKISKNELPDRENIAYLGMRAYDVLPNYLKGFDIAMMPFALNDSTRFISPTKTLEYMAAGKPIISTPVYDVVRDYKNYVSIIENAEEFSTAMKSMYKYLKAQAYDQTLYDDILHATSWDHTVNRMQKLISSLPAHI